MAEKVFDLTSGIRYESGSGYTINAQAADSITVRLNRNATLTIGVSIPLSEIGDEIEKLSISYADSGNLLPIKGYLNSDGAFERFSASIKFTPEMIYAGEYIVPCIRLSNGFIISTVTLSGIAFIFQCGGTKNIFLGENPVSKVYLGTDEIAAVFLGENKIT